MRPARLGLLAGLVGLLALLAAPPPGHAAGYELLVSASPDRSSAAPLAGRPVKGTTYVFVAPESGLSQVRFWLDDPERKGTPRKVEKRGPWDFAGTASNGSALPFDTTSVTDGSHTITAELTLSSGSKEIVHATFSVFNQGPVLIAEPDAMTFAVEPGGSVAPKDVTLETSDGSHPDYTVSDDAPWLDVTPPQGTAPDSLSLSVDAGGLPTGVHSATVTVSASGYGSDTLPVTLTVRDSLEPDQVHLAWVEEPATTLTAVWRTWDTDTPSEVRYRQAGSTAWEEASGGPRPSGTAGTLHEVTLRSLTPDRSYEYRVRSDNGGWSDVHSARTAPAPGPADFDAVYVADTGLIGRSDGLATGTEQVRDEIERLDPLLVLLGGDYAYYNTDKRYGSLDDTIDAWFNQMQPIGSRSPMMAAYGNHEILLDEGFDFWAPRFPTPKGLDGRRHYSFDVGDVHFVSILAVSETGGLSSSTLDWIEQDITAARTAGARWVIPFFHVSPFSDGSSHPSNLELRKQLGPLFERTGVTMAISSHDQNYERTFPLTDVPATNTPTSTSRRCYTQGDGVTWVKVSPGGKLSNKNGSFSKFKTDPPPTYTAFRDDTMHHFAHLRVSASGTVRFDTYGIVGDGTPPLLQDSFEYRSGDCPAELAFDPSAVSLATEAGATTSTDVRLTASDGSAADFDVQDDASWLEATPASGTTPGTVDLSVDATGLEPGSYVATVTATASGYLSARTTVALEVRDDPDLLVSTAADRSSPVPLDGETVDGKIYPFTVPDTGVSQVRFWLDDPDMSGTPYKVEKRGPWDFAGTAKNGSANPFDTTGVADGGHTITAEITLTEGGKEVASSSFDVMNGR